MKALTRRWEQVRFSVERQVAPHVDREWTEAALLELRLRGVPGDRIGDVLAEVDAHCVDSGVPAAEAFGDPVEYARSLDLPTEPVLSPRELAGVVGRGSVQVLGMLATLWGLGAWVKGEPLALTAGLLATLAVVVAAELSLLWLAERVLRLLVQTKLAAFAVLVAPLVVMGGLLLLLDQEVAQVPAAPVTLLGVAVVAVVQVLEVRAEREGEDDDPVVPPLGGATGDHRRLQRVLGALGTWSIPVWTVLLGALTWWVASQA